MHGSKPSHFAENFRIAVVRVEGTRVCPEHWIKPVSATYRKSYISTCLAVGWPGWSVPVDSSAASGLKLLVKLAIACSM